MAHLIHLLLHLGQHHPSEVGYIFFVKSNFRIFICLLDVSRQFSCKLLIKNWTFKKSEGNSSILKIDVNQLEIHIKSNIWKNYVSHCNLQRENIKYDFSFVNYNGERNFFKFWTWCGFPIDSHKFSKLMNCLRIFLSVQFFMSSLQENCRETFNKHIKIRKLFFTKKM